MDLQVTSQGQEMEVEVAGNGGLPSGKTYKKLLKMAIYSGFTH